MQHGKIIIQKTQKVTHRAKCCYFTLTDDVRFLSRFKMFFHVFNVFLNFLPSRTFISAESSLLHEG